jgi:nitrogenase molybdenum-iron protein alpha/beta subunit
VQRNYSLIAVVNSPGAALIGDDLDRFLKNEVANIPCLAIENTGFSGFFAEGFQNALIKVLGKLDIKPVKKVPKTVNLLGISIYHKHYAGSINEIKRLLKLCGIEVVTTFCAGDSLNDIMNFPRAEYNIVIYPECGEELARWLSENYEMPCLISQAGPPIGFEASETFIKMIAQRLEIDPTPALDDLEKARAWSFLRISRFNSISGLPKGSIFSVKADSSTAYTITCWLYSYLGMIPSAIEINEDDNGQFIHKLESFLESKGFKNVIGQPVNSTDADIVLADGNTLAQLRLGEREFAGIEISLPSLGYLDITEKSLFGVPGALMLLEQIINGLRLLYV